jgi:hypothetical protein
MEPEGSIPHSQAPATCPYPEPTQSSPYPSSHFMKINRNIILPSMPRSPKWSLSLKFSHQYPVEVSPRPNTRYMSRPSHSSPFPQTTHIYTHLPHAQFNRGTHCLFPKGGTLCKLQNLYQDGRQRRDSVLLILTVHCDGEPAVPKHVARRHKPMRTQPTELLTRAVLASPVMMQRHKAWGQM